jgi:hypothetical protein
LNRQAAQASGQAEKKKGRSGCCGLLMLFGALLAAPGSIQRRDPMSERIWWALKDSNLRPTD